MLWNVWEHSKTPQIIVDNSRSVLNIMVCFGTLWTIRMPFYMGGATHWLAIITTHINSLNEAEAKKNRLQNISKAHNMQTNTK